jgi:hypothetical protein
MVDEGVPIDRGDLIYRLGVALGGLVPTTLSEMVGVTAIIIAVAANTAAKAVYAFSFGGIAAYGGTASLSFGAAALWVSWPTG